MRVEARQILYALEKKYRNMQQPWAFFAEVKDGPTYTGMLKFDAVAIKKSWTQPCITGYEIKVSRSDFLNDEKWPGYLENCNKFIFVCPAGLIQPEELPATVGLMTFNPDNGALSTRKAAVLRPIDPPTGMYLYLIMNRVKETHHPFFGSVREELEAWVKDKEERKTLGYAVSSKLIKRLSKAEDECRQLKRDKSILMEYKETLHQVKAVMAKHGYQNIWNLPDDLDHVMSNKAGLPPALRRSIKELINAYNDMLENEAVKQEAGM